MDQSYAMIIAPAAGYGLSIAMSTQQKATKGREVGISNFVERAAGVAAVITGSLYGYLIYRISGMWNVGLFAAFLTGVRFDLVVEGFEKFELMLEKKPVNIQKTADLSEN
jgi:hypothetical protein